MRGVGAGSANGLRSWTDQRAERPPAGGASGAADRRTRSQTQLEASGSGHLTAVPPLAACPLPTLQSLLSHVLATALARLPSSATATLPLTPAAFLAALSTYPVSRGPHAILMRTPRPRRAGCIRQGPHRSVRRAQPLVMEACTLDRCIGGMLALVFSSRLHGGLCPRSRPRPHAPMAGHSHAGPRPLRVRWME